MLRSIQKASFLTMYLFTVIVAASPVAPPFYPQPVQPTSNGSSNPDGLTQIKVSIAGAGNISDSAVLVGNVTVCSTTACYRPISSSHRINVYDTKLSTSETVVLFSTPRVKITSIYFEDISGPKKIAGSIEVKNPLAFDQEYFGEDILVVVKKTATVKDVLYEPEVAVAGFFHPDGRTVYYNPQIATVASLALGTTLTIPAHATKLPQVFSIAVTDTRERLPLIDIYPEMDLDINATISTSAIKRPNADSNVIDSERSPNEGQLNLTPLKRTGVINLNGDAEVLRKTGASVAVPSTVTPYADATDECVAFLTANNSAITTALATTGTVYLSGCVNITPMVHIAISNIFDNREITGLGSQRTGNPYAELSLQPITNWSPGTQVAIDGFYWIGDRGMGAGVGYAAGFVQSYDPNPDLNYSLGNNTVGGGFRSSDAGWDINKSAIEQPFRSRFVFAEGTISPIFPTLPVPAVIISSSTSVIKTARALATAKTIIGLRSARRQMGG